MCLAASKLSHVKQRILNMEGKKLSKKSKTLIKTELNSSEIKAEVIENGKVHKKSKGKKKAKFYKAVNGDENKDKKAAKLVAMIQEPGAEDNVKVVQKKQKTAANNNNKNIGIKEEDAKIVKTEASSKIVSDLSEAQIKKIEKKKAKKAAQKLKKTQKKLMGKTELPKEIKSLAKTTKKGKEKPKKTSNSSGETEAINKNKQVTETSATTELQNDLKSDVPGKDIATEASDRVLGKKERKNKKRQQLKEQKIAEKAVRSPAQEEATVFVGNVPVNTKRIQLTRLFEKYGPVNSIRLRSAAGKVLLKHKMRKAAGSLNAYVVLQSKMLADKALELNGVEFKGVHLRVTKSVKEITAQKDNDEAKRTIFVGNLKYSANEEALREIFTSCGDIEYVRCIRDGEKGCKGVAYVCFKQPDAVGLALELKNTVLDERPIHVERYSISKLGAKEQRDAEAAKQNKTPKNKKPLKGDKVSKKSNNKKVSNEGNADKKSKKSEFRGVKVDGIKKKNKAKKIKNSQAFELAKKIAPKAKT